MIPQNDRKEIIAAKVRDAEEMLKVERSTSNTNFTILPSTVSTTLVSTSRVPHFWP